MVMVTMTSRQWNIFHGQTWTGMHLRTDRALLPLLPPKLHPLGITPLAAVGESLRQPAAIPIRGQMHDLLDVRVVEGLQGPQMVTMMMTTTRSAVQPTIMFAHGMMKKKNRNMSPAIIMTRDMRTMVLMMKVRSRKQPGPYLYDRHYQTNSPPPAKPYK